MKDLFCVCVVNLFIYLILYSQPFKVMHLDYIDEDVHPIDQCILYIHTVLTYLVQIPFCVITMPVFTACRKFISFVSALSMLISVKIINMLCYSFPRMEVARSSAGDVQMFHNHRYYSVFLSTLMVL